MDDWRRLKLALRDEDLQEEDVWAVMKESKSTSFKVKKSQLLQDCSSSSASASTCKIPAAPRLMPRVNSSESREVMMTYQSSAPVSIPDWPKIYNNKKKSSNKGYRDDGAWAAAAAEAFDDAAAHDDDDGDSDEMVPPHEFIARRLARSPIVSFSMCEGVGRTLKGRDLSKVRNAVLTKTGFLE